jgi:hypothetical protein
MNPRTPEILSRLCGIADTMLREQDAGALRPNGLRAAELGQVYGELATLRTGQGADAGYDESAVLLCQCLILLDERSGPLGDGSATKWANIAKGFLPWVRADGAVAIERAAHPATTDHDFQRGAR